MNQLLRIKQIFWSEVMNIWGPRVYNNLEMKFIVKDQKCLMSIGGFKKRPEAIGNMMVSMNKKHTLYISKEALKLSRYQLGRIIKHQVLHLGHQFHNEEFFKLGLTIGATLSGDYSKKNHVNKK
jgi:hypothetical protein